LAVAILTSGCRTFQAGPVSPASTGKTDASEPENGEHPFTDEAGENEGLVGSAVEGDFKQSDGFALAGAEQLRLFFVETRDKGDQGGEQKIKAWLQGVKQGEVVWQKTIPIPEGIRIKRSETTVKSSKGRFAITSHYSARHSYFVLTYMYNRKTIKLLKTEVIDPSQDVVDELVELATSGTRQEFDRYRSKENLVMYPGHYRGQYKKVLESGHETAMKLHKSGKTKQAVERLTIAMDASCYLLSLCGDSAAEGDEPTRWIHAWSECRDSPEPWAWVGILNDFGHLLQLIGQDEDAIKVFNEVVKADPKRASVYLNFADSQYSLKNNIKASEYYRTYKKMMETAGQTKLIPSRVTERSSDTK